MITFRERLPLCCAYDDARQNQCIGAEGQLWIVFGHLFEGSRRKSSVYCPSAATVASVYPGCGISMIESALQVDIHDVVSKSLL